jgi:NTE family protein
MPDLVVGCSAGAMFGALIAAGPQRRRGGAHRHHAVVGRGHAQRRWRAIPQMLWPRLGRFDADFALRDDRLVMQRLQQAFGNLQIEDLPLPLRVTTTDAATGERVVLRSGSLVQALRASIALPFMFAPVQIDGRRLIDGFIADPLPVSAAPMRAVLALGFESPMPRRIDGPSRPAGPGDLGPDQQPDAGPAGRGRRAMGRCVLSLVPTLTRRVGLFDTDAMPDLVDAGRRAPAQDHLPQIRALLHARVRWKPARHRPSKRPCTRKKHRASPPSA